MVIDMDYQALIGANLLPQTSGLIAGAQGIPNYGAQAAASALMPSTNFNPTAAAPTFDVQPIAAASPAPASAPASNNSSGGDQLSLFQKMQAIGGNGSMLPGQAAAAQNGGGYGFTNALQDMLGAWMMSKKASD